MKRYLFTILLSVITLMAMAQKEEESNTKGFDKENMFIGGSLALGFGGGGVALGVIPEVGYSLAQWLDVGILFNINYQTQNYSNYNGFDYKVKMFNYGTGTFLRIWPVRFINVTVQPEYNWINFKFEERNTGQVEKFTIEAESILVGIGYGNREVGNSYNTVTIMIDLMKNPNSPYRNQYNEARPIIRGTFGWYLGRGKRR